MEQHYYPEAEAPLPQQHQQQQDHISATAGHHPLMNYPLREIPHPHAHDVLFGRGGCTKLRFVPCYNNLLDAHVASPACEKD